MKKIIIILFLVLFVISCSKKKDDAALYVANRLHRVYFNEFVPAEEIELKDTLIWKKVDNNYNFDDSLEEDGIIYSTMNSKDYKGYVLAAFDSSKGEKKWEFNSKADRLTNFFIKDNKIIIGSSLGILFAIDKNTGEKLWEYKTNSEIYEFIYNHENTAICRDYFFNIYSVNIDTGSEIWRYIQSPILENGDMLYIGPILCNGNIIFKNNNNAFIGLDAADGQEKWHLYDTQRYIGFKINNGKIFFLEKFNTNTKTNLVCLDLATGKYIWNNDLYMDDISYANTKLYISGNNVFVVNKNKELYSFNKLNGKVLNKFNLENYNIMTNNKTYLDLFIYEDCISLENNIAYFLSKDKDSKIILCVVNSNTGELVSQRELGSNDILINKPYKGKIFIQQEDNKLLLIDLYTLQDFKKINIGFKFRIERVLDDMLILSESSGYYVYDNNITRHLYAIDIKEEQEEGISIFFPDDK